MEMYTAAATNVFHDFGKRAAGICPDCTGLTDSRFRVCEDHQPPDGGHCPNCGRRPLSVAQFACRVCAFDGRQGLAKVLRFDHDWFIPIDEASGDLRGVREHRPLTFVKPYDKSTLSWPVPSPMWKLSKRSSSIGTDGNPGTLSSFSPLHSRT